MISHDYFRAPSFRWLLAWAVLLCFGAGGTAYGQVQCPRPVNSEPPAIGGLGAGPGSADRTFGYSGPPNFNNPSPTLLASLSNPTDPNALINKIGIQRTLQRITTRNGEIRAIAVQQLGANANKFIVAGRFEYRVPNTTTVYRHIMRLDANGSIDTSFVPPSQFQGPTAGGNPDPGPINALAVDSLDRIVVGGEFIIPGPPDRSRLLRLTAGGVLDVTFNPPVPAVAVLALEVDPANNVYVGLNGGAIGGRQNFTRLTPTGALDNTFFWGPQIAPFFQASVAGPVRAIRYVLDLDGFGTPGVVVGGAFTQSTGGVVSANNTRNVTLFSITGSVDPTGLFFGNFFSGFDAPVNALAVDNSLTPSRIYAGGEFGNAFGFGGAPISRTRVAGFDGFNGLVGPVGGTATNPNAIPNPVRALVLTTATNTIGPPFARLHVGGQETNTAFGDVALSVTTGIALSSLGTTSPLFPANPAVVRAMAANSNGALFGGDLLNANGEKLVATPNLNSNNYNPPNPLGLPSLDFLANLSLTVGPTQFYASAIDPDTGDLYIGGDVGPDPGPDADPGQGNIAELYRINTCGVVETVARFRNVSGYLVRNDIDNGAFVGPSEDINRTPNMGFRRVDRTDPASIRAIVVAPDRKIYVGGQFNQVIPFGATTPVPWNNLVRLNRNGTIDPLFQVGQDDPSPPPGYTPIRKGGPTGFGAPGVGFSTVDPEKIVPGTGTCDVPPAPTFPVPGTGEKYNPNEGRVNAIVLQPDGKVLIGGEFKCYNEVPRGGIARLTATGSLDPTFGESSFSLPGVGDYLQCGNPATTTSVSRTDPSTRYERARVNAILLEPDGKVVVGGLFARANNVDRYNIARFNSDGTLDTGFSEGPNGTVFPTGTSGLGATLPTGLNQGDRSNGRRGEIFALARQNLSQPYNNAGKIVIGGRFNRILNPDGEASSVPSAPLARLFGVATSDPNRKPGRLDSFPNPPVPPFSSLPTDPAFASTLNFTAEQEVRAIAVKSDDQLLIGGPFLIGPRNLVPFDGIGYISNTTRARIHRTGVNGTFTDALDAFNQPRATFLAVPPGVGQNPNAPLVFQPGPYAVSLPAGFGGFPPVPGPLGSPASIFAPGSAFPGVGSGLTQPPPPLPPGASSEISYYPNLPFNTTPPFGLRFLDTRLTVNTITLDPSRRRAYIGGLFNTFESVRADFQNDSAGAPNGLNLDIRWPGVAALQNGSGCTYGLVRPSFPPFQPIPVVPGAPPVSLGAVPPSGGQVTIATMTRSAASLCNLQPTISTNANFVTIVGAVPRTTNPGFVDIIINVAANNTGTQRDGSITVVLPSELSSNSLAESTPEPESVTFTFTQGPASGCTFTAVAVPSSFPLAGGTGQFQITTGAGCGWNIGPLPTWISASPTNGSGSGTVNFTVAANTGAPRSATVTVTVQGITQNITITQAGTCTLTLGAATGTSLPVTGGTGSFTVTTSAGCTYTATSSAPWLVITGGASGGPTGTVAFSVGRNSGAARSATITVTTTGTPPQTQTVTVSQAPDSGADTVGMFRPSNGFFYLRFSNTSGNADIDFFYGTANDVPLSGDWNGDGITTIGIFRNGQFFLRNSNSAGFADVPAFAITGTQPGDIPIAGDWDGNGTTTAGLFRAGVFLLRNSNTAGSADIVFNYTLGVTDQLPLVGDWDGDGVTTVGLFRTSTAFFALRNTNSSGTPDLQFFFGNPNDVPVAGDWNGNGFTTIGVFRTGTFFLRNSNSSGPADLTVNYGVPTDRPVIGKWQ